MSTSLWIPTPWQHPGPGAHVNWSHPLAAGLAVCGLYDGGQHIEEASGATIPAAWLAADPHGGAVPGTIAVQAIPLTPAGSYQAHVTLLAAGYIYASPAFGSDGQQYLCGLGSSSATHPTRGVIAYGNLFRGSGGTMTLPTRRAFTVAMQLAVPNAAYGWTASWANGVKFATASSVFGDRPHSHWIARWGHNSAGTVAWSLSCAWTRTLSDDEVMAVMAEPFTFLTR